MAGGLDIPAARVGCVRRREAANGPYSEVCILYAAVMQPAYPQRAGVVGSPVFVTSALFSPTSCSVHMKIEEKISLTCGRDGGLQNMELHGMIMLRILDDKFARIRIHVDNEDKKGVQLQVLPWQKLRIWGWRIGMVAFHYNWKASMGCGRSH